MGCFSYICKGCGTPINGDCINGGESCILIHVRHGEIIGRTEGHYAEYGNVLEDSIYRNEDDDNPNGHKEICKSEFELEDSYAEHRFPRLYNGKEHLWFTYLREVVKEELIKNNYILDLCSFYKYIDEETEKQYLEHFHKTTLPQYADKKIVLEESMFWIIYFVLEGNYKWRTKTEDDFFKLPFSNLPKVFSGTVAWHSKCYHEATMEQQDDLTPSKSDPNQGSGRIRKKYV